MRSTSFSDDDFGAMRADLMRAAIPVSARDREDVVQEALLRLVETETPRPGLSLKAQARRRLHHAAVDHLRRESRRPPLVLVEPEEQASLDQMTTSEAEAWRRVRALRQQLEQLAGPDAAEYAVLKGCFELTERQIAARPGWSPKRAGAARKQLSRVKEQFRDMLDGARAREA